MVQLKRFQPPLQAQTLLCWYWSRLHSPLQFFSKTSLRNLSVQFPISCQPSLQRSCNKRHNEGWRPTFYLPAHSTSVLELRMMVYLHQGLGLLQFGCWWKTRFQELANLNLKKRDNDGGFLWFGCWSSKTMDVVLGLVKQGSKFNDAKSSNAYRRSRNPCHLSFKAICVFVKTLQCLRIECCTVYMW